MTTLEIFRLRMLREQLVYHTIITYWAQVVEMSTDLNNSRNIELIRLAKTHMTLTSIDEDSNYLDTLQCLLACMEYRELVELYHDQ